MLRKNVAGQFIYFAGVNATTGAALTGATFTLRISLDGTFAAKQAGTTITEDTGLGFYKIALAALDTNGNECGYFLTATNAVPVCLTVITTALDPTSTAFGLSLAKTTNITGFNDIAAPTGFAAATFPATVSSYAGGAVASVTGAVGSVTGLTASNLDATVSSRMATYAQPAGFLAATFPLTVASTTNITAGVITTTTNLTNAPTAGDLTAVMKTSVTTAATAATPIAASVTGAVGSVTGAVASVTANVNADVKKINAVPIVGNGSTIPFNV